MYAAPPKLQAPSAPAEREQDVVANEQGLPIEMAEESLDCAALTPEPAGDPAVMRARLHCWRRM
jgi:hypothetical protein